MNLGYTDTGKGEVVVLIHGFCESRTLWKDFEEALSVKYRVICPDLPGFGESRLAVDSVSMEYFAQEIKIFLDDLNIEKCTIVGHSLGGYVALAFAEDSPEILNGIGLFHSTAYADTEEKKLNRNKTITFIKENGVDVFALAFVPPLFNTDSRNKYSEEIATITKVAKNTDPLAVIETSKAMRDRKDRSEMMSQLNVPVLYIIGKEDNAVPLEISMQQCYLPNDSVVHILEDCGHMGMVEKKKETIKAIDNFVAYCTK